MSNPYVGHAVAGIKVVVCALMTNTVITLARKSFLNRICVGIAFLAFVLAMFTPVPTVLLVIVAGVFGVIMQKMGRVKV